MKNYQIKTQIQMNYINLDDLHKEASKQKRVYFWKVFFKEAYRFFLFFVVVLMVSVVFINFNIFLYAFQETFSGQKAYTAITQKEQDLSLSFKDIGKNEKAVGDDFGLGESSHYMDVINEKFSTIPQKSSKTIYERDMDKFLYSKLKTYRLTFNLLPPDHRLILDDMSVNVPIVNVDVLGANKFEEADFDEELYKWVVKYPFTPTPWGSWNVLIFGHTSYYWWKKNPYWEIFSKLPALKTWNKIKIVWDGKMYTYEIIDKQVRYPRHVKEVYEKYNDKSGKYLTLMGCYPIWTDSQRLLVVAKLVENTDNLIN